MSGKKDTVQVYIRVRPTARFADGLINLFPERNSMVISSKKDEDKGFINNKVLTWNFGFSGILHNSSQDEVYKTCASNLVSRCLDGYNCTLFAYGQTGSGKTYTMTGSTNDFKQRGIIPRAISQLYTEIKERYEYNVNVQISYLEIYNEQVYDLLASYADVYLQDCPHVSITEDSEGNAYAKGLSYHTATTEEEALNLLFEGEANRIRGHHQLNQRSTRSHCIFTIYIESYSITEDNAQYTVSKLNLVDLAGSERLGKTNPKGLAHTEATYINKSLTFLEQSVISLADKKRDHVPYRQSKLTHILKDAIGGSCLTAMIGNMWGEAEQIEETLSTLRFGNRVRSIPNEPAIKYYTDSAKQCKRLEKEVAALKRELAMYDTLTNRSHVQYEALSQSQIDNIKKQIQRFVDGETQDIEIINVRQVKEVFEQFKHMVMAIKAAKEAKQEETPAPPPLTEKRDTIMKGRGVRVKSGLITTQEDVPLVGETDGQGFGVGLAPPTVKPAQQAPIVTARKTKSRRGKGESANSADHKDSPQQGTPSGPQGNDGKLASGQENAGTAAAMTLVTVNQPGRDTTTSAAPPSREEAFEMFKKERGTELNRVLTENKGILNSKKKEVKRLVATINELKSDIDDIKLELEDMRQSTAKEGERVTTDNKPVIDETEFLLLQKQKDLKKKYRTNYEDLHNVRSDVQYCDRMVDQCRKRLVMEFEAWYMDCFGTQDDTTNIKYIDDTKTKDQITPPPSQKQESMNTENNNHEDEEENFTRAQMDLLMKDPESVAFYNAKMSSERRHVLRQSFEKRPGSVTSQIRNKPPSTLIVN